MTLSKVSHEHLRWIPFDPELSENTTTRADIPFLYIISPITLSRLNITSTHRLSSDPLQKCPCLSQHPWLRDNHSHLLKEKKSAEGSWIIKGQHLRTGSENLPVQTVHRTNMSLHRPSPSHFTCSDMCFLAHLFFFFASLKNASALLRVSTVFEDYCANNTSIMLIKWMKESSEEVMVWELDAALSHLCRGPWYSRRGGLGGYGGLPGLVTSKFSLGMSSR